MGATKCIGICSEKTMRLLLMRELRRHGITVKTWKKKSYSGQAWKCDSSIEIPVPDDAYSLGVGLHEIGHLLSYRMYPGLDKQPEYLQEYHAEQYAIRKLRAWRMPYIEYQADAIRYVMLKLAKYKNHKGDMSDVPRDIIVWTGIPIRKWKAADRVIVVNQHVKKISQIKVIYEHINI